MIGKLIYTARRLAFQPLRPQLALTSDAPAERFCWFSAISITKRSDIRYLDFGLWSPKTSKSRTAYTKPEFNLGTEEAKSLNRLRPSQHTCMRL